MGQMYKRHVQEGGWFLHEHPAAATSWSLQEIRQVMDMSGVQVVVGDQCMYGLKTCGSDGCTWARARKSTTFMSDSQEILREVSKRCDRAHEHQRLTGSRTGPSGRYPEELCRPICVGLIKEMRNQTMQINKRLDIDGAVQSLKGLEETGDPDMKDAWDDLTDEELDANEVQKARAKEMSYIHEKKVWEVIPHEEAVKNGWKIVKTRWIDIGKGCK